ncbi:MULTISPECIES: hypothetical protein [Cronobacter]|uniref:hypothetical protein n=1 Tax=Cronobacter TaxID=413496 RepID=UPI002893A7C2|nr:MULTISPECIES: hypothetical protein [Cronobacter]MDT3541939.1 hypothetical protein [Cronobacter sakazakii]MDT3603478.1 hypothetical protein [Cronobacter malonaticus]MDT3628466.1 hypothetical protein [Cronobacter sakazakii]MDT3644817.1 hypothetical protein [Cronobacter malonaticus]
MSFNLSRSQFLQMFAVMQSIKLINSHTAINRPLGLCWQNSNISEEQFSALVDLLSRTPVMPNLDELPSGSTAPILINPFAEGGYLPHTGPGFVVIPETDGLNITENVLFGAIAAHISTAFANMTRYVNMRATHITMPGEAFSSFDIELDTSRPVVGSARLCFGCEDGSVAAVGVVLPYVFHANKEDARQLIDIMRHFIGQSMIDSDIAAGVLTSDSVSVMGGVSEPVRREPVKTLEQKLMECPMWATW